MKLYNDIHSCDSYTYFENSSHIVYCPLLYAMIMKVEMISEVTFNGWYFLTQWLILKLLRMLCRLIALS